MGGCNLRCVWCDTKYTWDWENYDSTVELKSKNVWDVLSEVLDKDTDLVVITGGEPLLQQVRLAPLVGKLLTEGKRVEIETAGTIAPDIFAYSNVNFNVSPKLLHSGNPLNKAFKPEVLGFFNEAMFSIFKFVVRERSDLSFVANMAHQAGIPDRKIWIMPEGTTVESQLEGLKTFGDEVAKRRWNLTTRLHVLIWGDKRGV